MQAYKKSQKIRVIVNNVFIYTTVSKYMTTIGNSNIIEAITQGLVWLASNKYDGKTFAGTVDTFNGVVLQIDIL